MAPAGPDPIKRHGGRAARVVQQGRDLGGMLVRRLDLFEAGRLMPRAAGVDIAEEAIEDLRRRILDFDALIHDDEAPAAAGR